MASLIPGFGVFAVQNCKLLYKYKFYQSNNQSIKNGAPTNYTAVQDTWLTEFRFIGARQQVQAIDLAILFITSGRVAWSAFYDKDHQFFFFFNLERELFTCSFGALVGTAATHILWWSYLMVSPPNDVPMESLVANLDKVLAFLECKIICCLLFWRILGVYYLVR